MYKITVIITLIAFAIMDSIHAQESKQKILKTYINASYYEEESTDYDGSFGSVSEYFYEEKNLDIGYLSLAFELKKNQKLSHELELMPIWINRKSEKTIIVYNPIENYNYLYGGKVTKTNIYLRYQLNYTFNRVWIVAPYIGFSAKGFYWSKKADPYTSYLYQTKLQNTGIDFAFIPSLKIPLNKNLALDINIPVSIYEIKLNIEKEENPGIPVNEQTSSKIIGEFIPKIYNCRLGLCYSF
ncbi:MAG: hypothetical protein JXB49_05580 [Bacteroidales bacterium]|nr:hypothetical protein [Bacteroidales bacterium]MBN2818804.1 hypothetical protein [Bacteroidales bacterium]